MGGYSGVASPARFRTRSNTVFVRNSGMFQRSANTYRNADSRASSSPSPYRNNCAASNRHAN